MLTTNLPTIATQSSLLVSQVLLSLRSATGFRLDIVGSKILGIVLGTS